MITVLGSKGKIGGAALRALPEARGLTRADCDLRDAEGLTAALRGSAAVLAILPLDPGTFADFAALKNALLRSLAAVRPAHVVFVSDYGAQHPGETGIPSLFHELERRLRELGPGLTLLRSAEHMQNWLRQRRFNFYPSEVVERPFVSAMDVGRIAAELLRGPVPQTPRVVHAEGPRRYQLSELGDLTPVPAERRRSALEAAGLPGGLASLLDLTYAAHGQGLVEVEAGGEVARGSTELAEVLAEG